jgi:DNA mismatch repair protein MutS2
MIKNAREEAQRILRDAKDTADSTIRQINKLAGESGVGKELEAERSRLRNKLQDVDSSLSLKREQKNPKKGIDPKKLKLGDGVKVLSMNLNGTVNSLPNAKGDLYVQMGILRSLVNISDLELLYDDSVSAPSENRAKKTGSGSSSTRMSKSFSISPEINLIGMTTDEAIPQLDKYLDDAYLAHLPQVRVVHGRGTGALKNAVHKHLKRLKYVKEFRLGVFGEGDSGVTIVSFK